MKGGEEMENNKTWTVAVVSLVIGLVVGYWFGTQRVASTVERVETVQPDSQTSSKRDVQFVNHIQANLPEQDVFIEQTEGSNQVVRVEGEAGKDLKNLAKKAYAASTAVAHDPFKVGQNPLGPYPKGKNLGFTLGQWLKAQGSGTYTVGGGSAELNLTFTNLVPNGVYTVWCSRITFPPNPNVVDRPCGNPDGSENVFTADAQGNGTFNLKLSPLEESTKETASVVALAYHSDGKTYGENPGDFGLNSHVQIFYLLPAPGAEGK